MKSEKEKSNVTVTQRNTKEEKKIRNKIEGTQCIFSHAFLHAE